MHGQMMGKEDGRPASSFVICSPAHPPSCSSTILLPFVSLARLPATPPSVVCCRWSVVCGHPAPFVVGFHPPSSIVSHPRLSSTLVVLARGRRASPMVVLVSDCRPPFVARLPSSLRILLARHPPSCSPIHTPHPPPCSPVLLACHHRPASSLPRLPSTLLLTRRPACLQSCSLASSHRRSLSLAVAVRRPSSSYRQMSTAHILRWKGEAVGGHSRKCRPHPSDEGSSSRREWGAGKGSGGG
ncbi:hypothetical protein BDN70DRAFT_938147 [Pholiota conissans]|uniref:Uncharacterized protein n=1 Tax=Pholiota conissans TaxID=109636 RepID=A0A9P5YP34_9AGAR|nr:hypothetical protein BDN70DRAFT_938147 [Pholiota conissans]